MKNYDELQAEMDQLEPQMADAKKRERTAALNKVKELCKEFSLTVGMRKGALAEGGSRNEVF